MDGSVKKYQLISADKISPVVDISPDGKSVVYNSIGYGSGYPNISSASTVVQRISDGKKISFKSISRFNWTKISLFHPTVRPFLEIFIKKANTIAFGCSVPDDVLTICACYSPQ